MTMKPYPSNIIIFDVDESVLDSEMKLALKRSWTHIGEILIRSHAGTEDRVPSNFIHVMVKFGTRTYLNRANEDADANWSERIEQHLLSTMRKISNTVIAFNRRQRNNNNAELPFDSLEFALEAGALTLEYRLDSNGYLPTTCASIATDIRNALNAGLLGEPVRVRIPSKRSYQEQACAFAEAQEVAGTQEGARAQEGAAAKAGDNADLSTDTAVLSPDTENGTHENSDSEAAEWFAESPELVAEVEQEEAIEAQEKSPFEISPLTEEEWEARYGVVDSDFEIDYHMWEAIYTDGSSREFDSQAMQTDQVTQAKDQAIQTEEFVA